MSWLETGAVNAAAGKIVWKLTTSFREPLAGSMSLPTAGRSVRPVTTAYTGARFPTAGKYAKGFPRTRGDRPHHQRGQYEMLWVPPHARG